MGAGSRSRSSTALLYSASLAMLVACAKPSGDQSPAPTRDQSTTLEVVNRSSSDVDIFASRLGYRIRLGLAAANVTTWFKLLPGQIAGAGTVVFEARPLLGLARTIHSDPTLVSPGDTITLEIPPP